ncbi:hypothetical protein GTM66_003552 [Salmonella enterica]|nr:hypothetical protein [Salmonella enterica]
MLCHGTVCVVGKIRDLILQLSKSSIYSTKPIGDYVKIGNHLKTIVTSYLLSDLGINNIIIEKYQAQTIQE